MKKWIKKRHNQQKSGSLEICKICNCKIFGPT